MFLGQSPINLAVQRIEWFFSDLFSAVRTPFAGTQHRNTNILATAALNLGSYMRCHLPPLVYEIMSISIFCLTECIVCAWHFFLNLFFLLFFLNAVCIFLSLFIYFSTRLVFWKGETCEFLYARSQVRMQKTISTPWILLGINSECTSAYVAMKASSLGSLRLSRELYTQWFAIAYWTLRWSVQLK